MTAEIINLRQARKSKSRSDKERLAENNRQKFGRSKADKNLSQVSDALDRSRLEAHRIERAPSDTDDV
ncbi:DUF4169 family protein [Roseibium limicola]|uniref:DUF4169 family protein n=1 Tax=Roseibium limicola TaxID=2816037 RepID=A0A939J534_9HYPH|nr:DUF4169 family protein [Roseibium limicola]MBO0343672.1 DUF4169 family protein [Roseibium limicola]